MKNIFFVLVAVAIVLTFICLQQSSAVPLTVEDESGTQMKNERLQACDRERRSLDHWESGISCRFCCGCCGRVGCGICCKF
ncbi:hepcidin-like isoform X2 [Synchiropus splendidus]|uniref:hepcidin-like isoform X2 n=1 Tax=Synchiropus splendidus TaxID=270530 RepID=UPI00237DAB89|nr:hepcidin-like isoform X2 [Synchiropus splendidus]